MDDDTVILIRAENRSLAPVCATCGTSNPEGARFCRHCGAAFGPASAPAQQSTRDSILARLGLFALGVALGAAAAGGGAWYRLKLEKTEIEQAALRQAEQKYQQELRAARKRYEEMEQARIDAEQQTSHSVAVQEAVKREAEMTKAELRAAAAKAAREAKARQKEEERLRLEAAERKRAEEAAAASAANRPAVVVPRPAPPPPAPPQPPTQTAQASPEALCRSMTNFITRGICETRECIKPQYVGSEYCRSLRARASPSPTQP